MVLDPCTYNTTNFLVAWGEAIRFRKMEFIINRSDNLSFSPERNDSGIVLVGMAHRGSPSLLDILEESTTRVTLPQVKGESPAFQSLRVATW
jgi:hypothetical protein